MEPASRVSLYESGAVPGAEPARHPRPHERIAEEIGAHIRDGSLVRGQKLPTEREMSERFGVGRGVIREAVRMLDALGLVESRQGSGIYVRNNPIPSISRALTLSVTPEEQSVASLFEFRTVLEVAAAEQAALRRTEEQREAICRAADASVAAAPHFTEEVWHVADQQFHHAVGEASGNPYIAVAIDAIRQMQRDVTRLVREARGSVGAAEQHQAIAAAITARCPERAAAQVRAHIQYTADRWQQAQKAARGAGGE